jgi:tetratricopeptide (TPR) repeat protein
MLFRGVGSMLRPSLLLSGSALVGLLSWLCLNGECGWLASLRKGQATEGLSVPLLQEAQLPRFKDKPGPEPLLRRQAQWQARARELEQRSQAHQLLLQLGQFIEQEPGNARLYLQRAQYLWEYSQVGEPEQPAADHLVLRALRDLDIAIALDPYLPEAYLLKARIQHEHFGELEQALATLSPLDRIAYRNPQLHLLRSRIWAEQGHLESAFDVANLAIELAKQNQNIADLFDAYLHRGLMWASICNFQLAVADFSRAIELQPQRAEGYYHRGMARAYQGEDKAGAAADLESALSLWRSAGTGSPKLLQYVEAVRQDLLQQP